MSKKKIAIIGSGISGLSAAWLLSKDHDVTVYEKNNYAGGHANTVKVSTDDGDVFVDTGFIVFNKKNYLNLTELFKKLNVKIHNTIMSFSLSVDNGSYEYSGSGALGYFGQFSNIINPYHWYLLYEVNRFFSNAENNVKKYSKDITIGSFLENEKYSQIFIKRHILPMGAAIWSSDPNEMLNYPAHNFIAFYANHGMLNFKNRPSWNTVFNGSKNYISKIISNSDFDLKLNTAIKKIKRNSKGVEIIDINNNTVNFDHVVLASHADQSLGLLADPSKNEKEILSAFRYQKNTAVLHKDEKQMPKRKKLWSSWNYLKKNHKNSEKLSVTYWLNNLQELKTTQELFITINPIHRIPIDLIINQYIYEHPIFDNKAIKSQELLSRIQGIDNTWYCGSYMGYGFHEDGIKSGLNVAELLGSRKRPWSFADK